MVGVHSRRTLGNSDSLAGPRAEPKALWTPEEIREIDIQAAEFERTLPVMDKVQMTSSLEHQLCRCRVAPIKLHCHTEAALTVAVRRQQVPEPGKEKPSEEKMKYPHEQFRAMRGMTKLGKDWLNGDGEITDKEGERDCGQGRGMVGGLRASWWVDLGRRSRWSWYTAALDCSWR